MQSSWNELRVWVNYSSTGMRDIEFEVTLPERLYNCLADAMRKELWRRQYHELTLIVFNFGNNDYFSSYVLQLLYTKRQQVLNCKTLFIDKQSW